ncbi:unnamed protein product [Phyllotreta striolata]|uniref:Factor VIII intron 22 protein n=1 Tax=Phyllotreta striolata TaxID=444603 RepID=A0A9N9XR70_PHYSR|nr:unnamed protein product [Phyllotreta striolata]
MDSDSVNLDLLDQYMAISNKLKKRFLKRPNLAEACESFIELAKHCESLDLPVYAGLCWRAAASCEDSSSNNIGETSCLVQSARQLLKAEETDARVNCKSVYGEYLQAGLSCCAYAASKNKFGDGCSMQICLDLEIIDFLRRINKVEYVESYLEDAVELCKDRCDSRIYCLELFASLFIKSGDFLAALETYYEITKIIENSTLNGARCEILLKCEVNSVLLLLILRPNPQKLPARLAKILEKYTWGDVNDVSLQICKMTENVFNLLNSLVMTCQSLDTSSLVELETELWSILSKEQKELLRILLKTYELVPGVDEN